ncbi:hemolysin family protein [Massilia horti]|uniref:HlyC/CorC family transporter n=1 Tax=Massilia horti TaxID=2562153 RepID=A0A4Y9T6Q9_9BURK|nr:hemolysin family protein [Massilia horti]TFW33720.1 HlyC/CorC family transporter [Massilia horti]
MLLILALIFLNGILSMAEFALVSARRLRLEKLSAEGKRGARAALDLAEKPSIYLSTVQAGVTLVSIFNGAFGGASLVARLAPHIAAAAPQLAGFADHLALAIVVICIGFASIILGELVPKRIAMQHPERVATALARPLHALALLMSPLVRLLAVTTDFITRLLRMEKPGAEIPTEEEITGMLRESTEAGVFEPTEYEIVSRALRLDDRHLGALMTPRVDIEFLDLDDGAERNLARIAGSMHNRFPVIRHDQGNILGYVTARDLFAQAIRGHALNAVDIAAALKPLLFVPESVSAMDLLELFKKNRAELALVVDEYGDIQGIVTLADVMSVLVGEVSVCGEEQAPDAVRREDGSWYMDGGISLDRFREVLGAVVEFPGEGDGSYHTLAGFVLYQLGYIPKPSEYFDWDAYRFEIADMDGNRIDRLLVTPVARETAQ